MKLRVSHVLSRQACPAQEIRRRPSNAYMGPSMAKHKETNIYIRRLIKGHVIYSKQNTEKEAAAGGGVYYLSLPIL